MSHPLLVNATHIVTVHSIIIHCHTNLRPFYIVAITGSVQLATIRLCYPVSESCSHVERSTAQHSRRLLCDVLLDPTRKRSILQLTVPG